MSERHRKTVRTSSRATTAMVVDAREITLNAAFVAAVKAAYVSGNMQQRRPETIVPAIVSALRARQGKPLVSWNNGAIDVALRYLEGNGRIKLPSGELVAA